jgi:hypothetical protein
MTITIKTNNEVVTPGGKWNTARDWFPRIAVDQEKQIVTVTLYETEGYQNRARVSSELERVEVSEDGTQAIVTGEVECRNFCHGKCSGAQKFCYCVFVGDSNHIYIHRAIANKKWLELEPEQIRKRLVKLGVGATEGIIQQGDFVLKPANGAALPPDEFKHEYNPAGHHKFSQPVLAEYRYGVGTIVYIPEGCTVELIHEAVDGIQHPTRTVPAGQWIIKTTASSLRHSNRRD